MNFWASLRGSFYCCDAQCFRSLDDRLIFVLSAHLPGDELASLCSPCTEEDEDESWLGSITRKWGSVLRLFPFSTEVFSASVAKSKGGLCTQSLLAVLQHCGEKYRGTAAGQRSMNFPELLHAMQRVISTAGFPSTVLTLRSSFDISSPYVSGPVAWGFPTAQECREMPRALLVGICYKESAEWKLDGSWNDVMDLQSWLLSELGWSESFLRVLKDDAGSTLQPTRDNILKQLEWLFADQTTPSNAGSHAVGASPADVIGGLAPPRGCRLFHFCGHGGENELYPLDWQSSGPIRGEELAQTVARYLRRGTTFTCILDCCESSSLFKNLHHELQLPVDAGVVADGPCRS